MRHFVAAFFVPTCLQRLTLPSSCRQHSCLLTRKPCFWRSCANQRISSNQEYFHLLSDSSVLACDYRRGRDRIYSGRNHCSRNGAASSSDLSPGAIAGIFIAWLLRSPWEQCCMPGAEGRGGTLLLRLGKRISTTLVTPVEEGWCPRRSYDGRDGLSALICRAIPSLWIGSLQSSRARNRA
jgi:hypothetical protein